MKAHLAQSIISNIRLNNAIGQMESVVSLALAYCLPIPTEKTDEYVIFYNNNCLLKVRDIVASLNELQVFDVDSTIERTKLEYIRRYKGIYAPQLEACETLVGLSPESLVAYEYVTECLCKELRAE
jgi:hypothetical protein